MTLSLIPKIGAIAGWKLELTPFARGTPSDNPALAKPPVRSGKTTAFSSVDYRGSVDATLVGGLGAGSYSIVIEGVGDEDYQALVDKAKAQDRDLLEAKLYLYWLDVPGSSYLGDGLVAVLRVTALRRRAGKWRYEMIVEGREMVYDQLARVGPAVSGHGPIEAAAKLARAMFVELSPPPLAPPTTEVRSTDGTATVLHELADLEKDMVAQAAATPKHRAGLGMYLIHNGTLRLGPDRLGATVVPESITDAGDGLLVIDRTGLVREDEQAISLEDTAPKHRDQYTLTLRGRPDLRPGSVISFDPPERSSGVEDLGFALGPAAPDLGLTDKITAYVQEVTHHLSREKGFITVVRCVGAGELSPTATDLVDRLWFQGTAPDTAAAASSGESLLVRIINKLRGATRDERWPDVAQVRAHYLDAAKAPAQTERLWRGLADGDGAPYAAGRLGFGKTKKDVDAAPYLTPFAYGKTGLVLPRYPGTRVVVMNRGGDPGDPIDVGALWSRADAPSTAQIGDWWLSLPVDLDGSAPPPATVDDNNRAEQRIAAKTTHDLTDASGNRVIEVGKLTIRIGKDGLRGAGERPPIADPPVMIEHDSGKARISIAQDGSITIETQKTLTLKGSDGIALETTKGITMTVGQQVTVKKGGP